MDAPSPSDESRRILVGRVEWCDGVRTASWRVSSTDAERFVESIGERSAANFRSGEFEGVGAVRGGSLGSSVMSNALGVGAEAGGAGGGDGADVDEPASGLRLLPLLSLRLPSRRRRFRSC